MTTKFGHFSEPEYLSPVAANQQARKRSHENGKQAGETGGTMAAFHTLGGKSGKLNDATFAKYISIHRGDHYQDAGTRLAAKRAKILAAQKTGTLKSEGKPFRPASPGKHATAPQAGETYGTISASFEHLPGTIEKKLRKGEVKSQPRSIYTSPMKQGGFGFNLTTLSERQGFKGVAGEYAYIPDPIRQPQTSPGTESKAATVGPFRPASGSRSDPFSRYEYVPMGAPILPKGGANISTAPFRPTYSGSSQPLNPPAEYIPCPAAPLQKGNVIGASTKYGAFKPCLQYRSGPTPSVLRMNIK